ncbi:MAG: ester cyclase [Frankiaceae bacterium]|nr:ester cyclase [Frankiaceae bacterium]MBV9871412.1 ester cyclase [Frankiaceae bacterium]
MTNADLRAKRETVVRTHFESEAAQEFDVTLSTFDHPRYEVVATNSVYDGADEVMKYYTMTRTAFPDQRHDNVRLHHTDDAVIAEFDLLGTHRGELMGIPPTGKTFRCPVVAIFFFEGEKIVIERIYFDTMTIMSQLGVAASPVSG